MLKHDLDAHVHHMASIWNPSGSLWAQLQPNSTLGPSWDPLGASRSQLAQVRRKLKLEVRSRSVQLKAKDGQV